MNTYNTQVALAANPDFINRVRGALIEQAHVVLAELPVTPNHQVRKAYAQLVLAQPETEASRIAKQLVHRPNVKNFATTWDFERAAPATAAGDADIYAQIAADWNVYAKV